MKLYYLCFMFKLLTCFYNNENEYYLNNDLPNFLEFETKFQTKQMITLYTIHPNNKIPADSISVDYMLEFTDKSIALSVNDQPATFNISYLE
jgi:hypothetical protein